jgi:hypothetical protein
MVKIDNVSLLVRQRCFYNFTINLCDFPACCSAETANTPDFDTLYGPDYSWKRCGNLSPACEAWFIDESCFYECDVNGGRYRRYKDCSPDNEWEMVRLPLRASDCDQWYQDCYNDVLGIPPHASFYDWVAGNTCIPMKDIYSNGKELCEVMWGSSFVYEKDETKAFTLRPGGALMGKPNVNDFVVSVAQNPPVCSINKGQVCNFLTTPSKTVLARPSDIIFNLCSAWQDNGMLLVLYIFCKILLPIPTPVTSMLRCYNCCFSIVII